MLFGLAFGYFCSCYLTLPSSEVREEMHVPPSRESKRPGSCVAGRR